MTITYSIDHIVSSTESVNVEVADKAHMTLQGTDRDPKTGELSSVYVLSTGDNSYPSYVTYRCALQKRATGLVRRISVTFDTWAVKTDDVAGTVDRKPISGTVSFNTPADMTIETSDLDEMLGNLISFQYLSVTGGARDITWLGKLLFGVPQVA